MHPHTSLKIKYNSLTLTLKIHIEICTIKSTPVSNCASVKGHVKLDMGRF